MIGFLIAISFAAGVIAPLIATVAFVLYFSLAAALAIGILALLYGASLWMTVVAVLATIVSMQAGFALSLAAMAMLRQRERSRQDGSAKSVMAAGGQDRAPEGPVHDDQRNPAG